MCKICQILMITWKVNIKGYCWMEQDGRLNSPHFLALNTTKYYDKEVPESGKQTVNWLKSSKLTERHYSELPGFPFYYHVSWTRCCDPEMPTGLDNCQSKNKKISLSGQRTGKGESWQRLTGSNGSDPLEAVVKEN